MKKSNLLQYFWVILMIISSCHPGFTQIPQTPTIQILLTDNTGISVADGMYNISVSLYSTATGGIALWNESQSVDVSGGIANIVLGANTPLTVPFDKQYYVGINIGANSELSPRLTLNPSVYSITARAVYGSDNIFPESGDVGIGTLTPMAKLDIAGKLRIEDVPVIDSMAYVLVYDSLGNKIVKAMRADSFLHVLNKIAWEYPWYWPGNVYSSDSVGAPGADLIVRDTEGNVVFKVDAEKGESYQAGLGTYNTGMEIPQDSGGVLLIDRSGITFSSNTFAPGALASPGILDVTEVEAEGVKIYKNEIDMPLSGGGFVKIGGYGIEISNSEGKATTTFMKDGTSFHEGKEYYKKGIAIWQGNEYMYIDSSGFGEIKVPLYGGGYVKIDKYGIAIFDSTYRMLTYFNEKGRSYHAGSETFAGGIEIPLKDGGYIGIDSTGFNEIKVPLYGGGYVKIDKYNGIVISDSTGKPLTQFDIDGKSYHCAKEYFLSGIYVPSDKGHVSIDSTGLKAYNSEEEELLTINPDGTSTQKGKANYEGGITLTDSTTEAPTITFNPDGTSSQTGEARFEGGVLIGGPTDTGDPGPEIRWNPDGTSSQTGEAKFGGGVVITNGEGIPTSRLNPDGTSTQTGKASFDEGLEIPLGSAGGKTVINKQGITLYDGEGNSLVEFWPDGTSYHYSPEHYEGGIIVPLRGEGRAVFDSLGFKIYDSEGNILTEFDSNGNSYHAGREIFAGGIEIPQFFTDESLKIDSLGIEFPLHGGGFIKIDELGFHLYNSEEEDMVYFDLNGTSWHKGPEIYSGGIYVHKGENDLIRIDSSGFKVYNSEEKVLHSINPNGTSFQSGTGTFAGGILAIDDDETGNPSINAGTVVCDVLIAEEKDFRIDHPLDPENKYLYHASIESNEMANMYNGNAILDSNGTAEVVLPEWFEALNGNFRYQLTPIGAPGPNLYISGEIENNRFKIAGGQPGMKVSWQVTGTRKDTWAVNNPLQVEVEKSIEISANSDKND